MAILDKNHGKKNRLRRAKNIIFEGFRAFQLWKYLVLLPKMINSDAKNHSNYLQTGKFRAARGIPLTDRDPWRAGWFCR